MVIDPNLSGSTERPSEHLMNPIGQLQVPQELSENVILTSLNDIYDWARLHSLWPLLYGTACCFIEFAAMIGPRFDFDRFGLIPRSSPRQADLLILAGTINMKQAPATLRLYEQMPHPKYVIAMGACMITGGMFSSDSPTTVRGADKLLPIDVYIPGCPPRPEAVMDAIIKLRKKVATEDIRERDQMLPTHRYYSTTHRMKPVPQIHTGLYLESPTRQQAPKELVEQMGMPVVPALKPEAEKVT